MAHYWMKQSIESLVPRSVSDSFKEALHEWHWTGNLADLQEPSGFCELCTHPGVRYQFEIENALTSSALWVGSECIKKFTGIKVYSDDNELLEGDARDQVLDKRIEKAKTDQMKAECRELFRRLGAPRKPYNREQEQLAAYMNHFNEHAGFSPEEVLWIFRKMDAHAYAFNSRLYRISLRRKKHREQLEAMSPDERDIVWQSLSANQRANITQKEGPTT